MLYIIWGKGKAEVQPMADPNTIQFVKGKRQVQPMAEPKLTIQFVKGERQDQTTAEPNTNEFIKGKE